MRSRKSKKGVRFLKEGKLIDLLEARRKDKKHFKSNGKNYSYKTISYDEKEQKEKEVLT
jgi:hypothetical protein